MARFRLLQPHYLNVPDNFWEQKETDEYGQQRRHLYPVPRLLDPKEADPRRFPNGIIVTTKAAKEFPGDIEFSGPPSPEMEPLDAEAEALVEEYRHLWKHPIDTLPAQGGMSMNEQLEEFFGRQAQAVAKQAPAQAPASDDRLASLEAQIAELKELLADKAAPKSSLKIGAP
jgi:hypothetical protein